MKLITLSPDEVSYLSGLLREHLEYYRLLSGNAKASELSRTKLALVEALWMKLK